MPRDAELTTRYGLENCACLLTVARLARSERYKGYDRVIQTLPYVLKEVGPTRYLVVGAGDDLPRVRKMASDLGLSSHVVFCGYVPDAELPAYYNLCDVFLLPSKEEGFGIACLEALACGKPVIAGHARGSPEAVLHGQVGLLVDPDDVQAIAKAIVKLLKAKARLLEADEPASALLDGDFLRKRVLETYGVDVFTRKVCTLMDNLRTLCNER